VTNVDGDIEASYEDDPYSANWLTTSFEYGPLDKVTKVTLPDRTTQESEYDVLGRQTKLIDPSSGTTTTRYTPFGEVDTITDGEGRLRTLVHDALSRLISTVTVDGTATNVWDTAEHGKGMLARATSADGVSTVYTYTEFGQLETAAWTIDGVSYQMAHDYDNQGRPDTLTYPVIPGAPNNSGRFTLKYGYKNTGYLETVRDAAAAPTVPPLWTAQSRDGAGQLTKEQYGNGTITHRIFDHRHGLLKSTWVTGPDGPTNLARVDYNHDANRNVDQRFDVVNGRNLRYEYDDLHRLERWLTINSTPSASGTYTYNSVGRLESETLNQAGQPAETITYTFGANGDPPHAVTGRNNQPYTYDGIGRQTSGGGRTITYTADNHPRTIAWGQGQRTDYRYDANGVRVKDTDPNQTTVTVPGLFDRRDRVDGTAQVHNVHHVVVDGRVVADVVRIQDHATAPISDTSTVYLHNDLQGSPILLTNANGREMGNEEGWLTDLAFDPFGRRVDATYEPLGRQRRGGPRLGYTGHEHDDHIGLVNMKGRTYDPETRTFLTPDPFLQDPISSQSYNRYAYVTNNPATRTDPTGFWGRQERIWEGLRTWRIDEAGTVVPPDELPSGLAGAGLSTGTVTLKPAGGAGDGTQAGRTDDDSTTTLNAGQGDTGGNGNSGGSNGNGGNGGKGGKPDWSVFDDWGEDTHTSPGSEPPLAEGTDPGKEITPDPDADDIDSNGRGGGNGTGRGNDPDTSRPSHGDVGGDTKPSTLEPRDGPRSRGGRGGLLGAAMGAWEVGETIQTGCQEGPGSCVQAAMGLAHEALTGFPAPDARDPTRSPFATTALGIDWLMSPTRMRLAEQEHARFTAIMGGKGWDMRRQ
jgi:RHS repeat-associated protein